MEEGLRYNEGKTRYDLLPPFAQEQYAKVYTLGSNKYAERNWEKGMKWSKVTASLKRHIAAFERGEDYDKESGLLHMAHAMCNASFLLEYYKIYPVGDDRPKQRIWRIGLDIDDVLADFIGAMMNRFNDIKDKPKFWNDPLINKHVHEILNDKLFYLNIKPKVNPDNLTFEPVCYVTSRNIPCDITKEWLFKNGFPDVPLITVGYNQSKVEALKDMNVDIFVDDRYDNFMEINAAGICCYLMTAEHNKRYDVGFKRINDLNEIFLH